MKIFINRNIRTSDKYLMFFSVIVTKNTINLSDSIESAINL